MMRSLRPTIGRLYPEDAREPLEQYMSFIKTQVGI